MIEIRRNVESAVAPGQGDTQKPPLIQVWKFRNAPAEYRDLSGHGGDEDWVMFVPQSLSSDPQIAEICERRTVSCHEVSGGCVYIGAHA